MAKEQSTSALRCPSCGSSGAVAGSNCGYCGSKLMTVTCTGCLGQMFEGSRYCPHCGAEGAIVLLDSDTPGAGPCPRCAAPLGAVTVGGRRVDLCSGCGGNWVSAATLEQICADRESHAAVAGFLQPGRKVEPEARVRYLKCPECSTLMSRKNYAAQSGVIMDVCPEHGIFLDRDELRHILEFIRNGGLDRARGMQIDNFKREAAALEQKRWDEISMPSTTGGPFGYDATVAGAIARLVISVVRELMR